MEAFGEDWGVSQFWVGHVFLFLPEVWCMAIFDGGEDGGDI